jgi:hypothetical protein
MSKIIDIFTRMRQNHIFKNCSRFFTNDLYPELKFTVLIYCISSFSVELKVRFLSYISRDTKCFCVVNVYTLCVFANKTRIEFANFVLRWWRMDVYK